MSSIKKALRSELGLKTRTTNELKEEKEEDYEPTNQLAEQVITAVNTHFNEREEIQLGFPDEYDDIEELELTGDLHTKYPKVASIKHQNGGLLSNIGTSTLRGTPSYSEVVTNKPLQIGSGFFGNNYNMNGQKNTIDVWDITVDQVKQGYVNTFQKEQLRFDGNITPKALLESLGGPWTKKYQGIPV